MPLVKNMTSGEVVALRAAERDIDQAYSDSALLQESLGTAIWEVLSFVEDLQLRPIVQGRADSSHRTAADIDETLNALKFPMAWLHGRCNADGALLRCHDPERYQSAWDILELARKYYGFSGPFEYWTRGDLGLRLEGTRIIAERDFNETAEYEGYNRLMDYKEDEDAPAGSESLTAELDSLVRVKGTRFTITLNPRLMEKVITSLETPFQRRFTLPECWKFSRYSLREFRLVYLVMFAMAAIRRRARIVAAARGCLGLGVVDSVMVTPLDALIARLTRYTGLPVQPVVAVLNDLTYGSRGQLHPDPALQPLIHLSSGHYALAPFLWLHSSPERNLCVLLNRIPEERALYSRLKGGKERVMVSVIEAAAQARGFRTIKGTVTGREDLGDIDLAIISDSEQACLVLELKWFIGPAEVREIFERREELQKGIAQVEARVRAIREGCPACLSMLQLAPARIQGVVVSKNWIGDSAVQKQPWPVISEQHLIAKLNVVENLSSVMEWLARRQYLPMLGKHFCVETTNIQIGSWATEWYGINSLVDGPYLPL